MTLRQAVGWIGTLLPIVLLAGNQIFGSGTLPGSMSAYYYTVMRNVFVAALCVLGVFLADYAGYGKWDNLITTVAGCFAIGVALCPTKPSAAVLTTRQTIIGDLHLFFAAVMFIALAVMAFRFCKTAPYSRSAPLPRRKRRRNIVYRTCGCSIAACLLLAVILNFAPASVKAAVPWLFILEALAVFAFGASWFVKGQTLLPILKDEPAS
jgi:hypothetical protein